MAELLIKPRLIPSVCNQSARTCPDAEASAKIAERRVTSRKIVSPASSGMPLMLEAVALYETELPPSTIVPELPEASFELECFSLL